VAGSLRSLLTSPESPFRRALRLAAPCAALLLLAKLGVTPCPVALVTGHPCPGCGLTRATGALLHGDFQEALRLHPLAPLVSPLLGGFLAVSALRYVRTGRWPAVEGKAAGWVAAAGIALWALLVGVWVARFYGALGGPATV
jgi:hypothetical protein